jgi:hypothetical protein
MPRNVARHTLKAMRRERRRTPSIEALLARWRRETPQERAVRDQAEELLRQLQADGVTWAACVQAVKTRWVASLLAKCEARRRERGGAGREGKARGAA